MLKEKNPRKKHILDFLIAYIIIKSFFNVKYVKNY